MQFPEDAAWRSIRRDDDSADFISKKVDCMVQAIRGSLADDWKAKYSELSTDSERFAFVWNQASTHEVIVLEPEFLTKSIEKAHTHREKGNEYFQKNSYLSALREYNLSVISAPYSVSVSSSGSIERNLTSDASSQETVGVVADDSTCAAGESLQTTQTADDGNTTATKNELALALANRSAALLHLKRYGDCLRDIELALQTGYPDEIQYKLFERRGAAYLALGNVEEATLSFQKALECVLAAGLSAKATTTWQTNIAKQMDACKKEMKKSKKDESDGTKLTVPSVNGATNPNFLCASDAVKYQYDATNGRHFVAAKDIKVGDVLISEKPYVSAMLPGEYLANHCYQCCAVTTAPVPCRQCSAVLFCSRECRDAAWMSYHSVECSFGELLAPSMCAKIGHIAIRLLLTQDIKSVLSYARSAAAAEPKLELATMLTDNVYDTAAYDSIYHLVANTKLRKAEDLFEFTILACVLVKIMIASGYLKEIAETSADLELVGGIMLHHLQSIQCNALRITEISRPTKFDEPRPEPVGVGLYPTVSLVNHSCDPNADLNFYGNTVAVRAVRNIRQGEEICISYGPVFYEVKAKRRHSQLKGVYFFNCKCEACAENWPIVEEMFDDVPRYRCENCRAPLATEDKFERKYFTCCVCKHKQDMEDVVGRLQLSYDVFARAMNTAMNGGSSRALPDFVQHLLLLQTYIRHPWRDLAACQSAVKYCYRLMANIHTS